MGDAFDDLDPALRRYFGALPTGGVGRGVGRYDEAGYCGPRWLRPAFHLLVGRDLLFAEFARDVPFTVANRSGADGVLRAERTFDLPVGRRRMVDAMTATGPRRIVDRLGRRGGLEVVLHPSVAHGGMRLASTALALRVGGMRVPLPPLAQVVVDERVDSAQRHRQRVSVTVRVAGFGEVFRYGGSFVYRIEPVEENPAQRCRTPSLD